MKTYPFYCLFLVCIILSSCSKSDLDSTEQEQNTGHDADYNLLLSSGTTLKSVLLSANGDQIALNPDESPFVDTPIPDLIYKEGANISMYHIDGACSGKVVKYDFIHNTSNEIEVFADLGACALTALAIAHSTHKIYIAYGLEITSKDNSYFVRTIDLNGAEPTFVDLSIDKKPIDLVFSNDRLFILTFDEEITDENALSVMDTEANSLLTEIGLGYDAHKLIKNIDGNLIIVYDELHTLMNSESLAVQYVNYEAGKEPNFKGTDATHFSGEGSLYYARDPGSYSDYPLIPAVYDFGKNLSVLYAYENFLTENERNIKYMIETTTMVGYDPLNGYILVGYKKSDGSGKGGLLRIKPTPDPAVIDHLDLDGVPYEIIVK